MTPRLKTRFGGRRPVRGLLRGAVAHGPYAHARCRSGVVGLSRESAAASSRCRCEHLGEAEVEYLRPGPPRHDDVGGLRSRCTIPLALATRGRGELDRDRERGTGSPAAGRHELLERRPVHVLEHDGVEASVSRSRYTAWSGGCRGRSRGPPRVEAPLAGLARARSGRSVLMTTGGEPQSSALNAVAWPPWPACRRSGSVRNLSPAAGWSSRATHSSPPPRISDGVPGHLRGVALRAGPFRLDAPRAEGPRGRPRPLRHPLAPASSAPRHRPRPSWRRARSGRGRRGGAPADGRGRPAPGGGRPARAAPSGERGDAAHGDRVAQAATPPRPRPSSPWRERTRDPPASTPSSGTGGWRSS